MRPTTAAMALALGIGLPCTMIQIGGFHSWAEAGTLAGVGFAFGLILMVALDELFYRREQHSFIRQREAQTDATQVSTLERKAKLFPPQDMPNDDAPISDQLSRLERQREFEVAHWRVYFRRLFAAGTAYGWDIRTLTDKKRETRVTTQPGWNLATDKMVEAGVLAKDGGTRALVSQAQWDSDRMWEAIPCPDGEPPEILPPPYTRQQTPQNNTAKQAIVDG